MEKCKGVTKKGTPCPWKGKYEGYCKSHSPKNSSKSEPIHLPRLPENISQKLANCSNVGIEKIKKQIIDMWLEDGGDYLILKKYTNRIPVAQDVYKELLKIFNQEEVVLSQIFVTENFNSPNFSSPKEDNSPKESVPIGSSRPPLVPIKVHYYSDFIPTKGKVLSEEQEKSFQTLKSFIQKEWLNLKEILHNNLIYLTPIVYANAKNFIRNKIKEVNDIYTIDVEFWLNYLMKRIFALGKEPTKSSSKTSSKTSSKIPKKEFKSPMLQKVNPIPKTRKFQIQNVEEELKKIFPDKDISLYTKIVKVNASNYPIQSKVDIHKLYLQFHPDKCDSNPKTIKLCNVFCGKVENIKKCFEFSKNPKVASPIRSRGDDTESILKILNDEV